MSIARFSAAIPFAALITLGLFSLMTYLISTGENPLQEEQEVAKIDFTRVERNEDVNLKDRSLPDQPEKVETPPPPPPSSASSGAPDSAGVGNFGTPRVSANLDLQQAGLGSAPEGDILPLVRVAPQYPRRAMSRGIEGWVQLSFSISPTGSPTNVEVVDADPQNIFNRAAVRAVEKWKYKPKVVNGQPVMRHGVEVVISFNLED